MKLATNPSNKDVQNMKDSLKKEHNKIFTDEEAKDAQYTLLQLGSMAMSLAIKKYREERKVKKIKEWKKKDQEKDEKVLATKPFTNIKCSVCNNKMKYKWSQLEETGTWESPKYRVMFFYECVKDSKRVIIYDDGEPFVSTHENNCPICNAERTTTVTRDRDDKIFLIHQCTKCTRRQVESY